MSTSNETVLHVALSLLHEAPNNPRKTYSAAGMDEMTASIAAVGILQPIVVRPMKGERLDFEIIFGHRRFRGARMACLEEVPIIVRPMTDAQADAARLHENLEREDVHYIEQAEAMGRLMNDHGVTADALVEQTGMSRTQVYGTLKLVALDGLVRKRCLQGHVPKEVAMLIGRVPRSLQAKALDRVLYRTSKDDPASAWLCTSYRQSRTLLRDHFTHTIAEAEFDTEDPHLCLNAPACSTCPHNSSNAPAFEDLGAGMCTNPPCFAAKEKSHEERRLAAWRSTGKLIEGDAARAIMEASDLNGHCRITEYTDSTLDGAMASWQTVLASLLEAGRTVPEPMIVLDPTNGRELQVLTPDQVMQVRQAVAQHTGRAVAEPAAGPAMSHRTAKDDDGDPLDLLPMHEQAVLKPAAWLKVRDAIMARVQHTARSAEDLRLIALWELEVAGKFDFQVEAMLGWPNDLDGLPCEEARAYRKGAINTMSAEELGALLTLAAISSMNLSFFYSDAKRVEHLAQRTALAARYGVDALAVAGLQDTTADAPDLLSDSEVAP